MDQTELNRNLKEVIKQAQDIGIPVPADICEQVDINPRPKKRYGCCRLKNGVYHIEVSEFILDCDPDKIRGVIAHEVLHTCRGCYNHGDMWKRYAAMMNSAYGYNIKRTSSNEEMGISDTCGSEGAAGRPESADCRDTDGMSGFGSRRGHAAGGAGSTAGDDTVFGRPGSAYRQGTAGSGSAGRKTSHSAGAIKYIIRCKKCGREYPRQRCSAVVKNPKAYRCRCGGRLTVFEIRRTADLCMKET